MYCVFVVIQKKTVFMIIDYQHNELVQGYLESSVCLANCDSNY